jgi:hypothetical protein
MNIDDIDNHAKHDDNQKPAAPEKGVKSVGMQLADGRSAASEASEIAAAIIDATRFDMDSVVVSEDDREAMITALISGEPFKKTYRLFGGRVLVSLKAPKEAELEAVVDEAYRRFSLSPDISDVQKNIAFSNFTLRGMIFFTVSSIGGVKYPGADYSAELKASLVDGKVVEPPWVKLVESSIMALDAAKIELVQSVCRDFHARYSKLVNEARQNF